MKIRCAMLFLTAAVLLSGCRPHTQTPSQSPIVTQIVATVEDSEHFLRRFYNTDEKMQAVLLCIRRLRPRFTPALDPEPLKKPTLCITMTCNDGSERLYRLKDIHFLQTGTDPWKKVDTGPASDLWRLLWEMESDPETPRTFHVPLPRLPHNWVYPYGKNPFA